MTAKQGPDPKAPYFQRIRIKMNTSSIVQKLWNYCNVLRDDGMSYGDYPVNYTGQANSEQLTYLLFLKMADERTRQLLLRYKVETIHGERFATRWHAEKITTDYIDRYYNVKRRHSTLGLRSPQDYELANVA
jgi:transposase InsO family protein